MKLLSIPLLTIILIQCTSVKFSNSNPFKVKSAIYTTNGNVKIYYNSANTIVFDSIFFNGKKRKVKLNKNEKGTYLTASFNNSLISLKDLQLHKNPAKEYGNTPPIPIKDKKIPFKLKENEAVISYKINGKTNYYKVKNLQKK